MHGAHAKSRSRKSTLSGIKATLPTPVKDKPVPVKPPLPAGIRG
jgi:hypothetical protein